MFLKLLLIEEKKILKHWILWTGILVLSAIITLSMIAMANSNPYPEIIQRQIVWPMVLVVYLGQFAANPIGAGLILVAVASASAQEYGWHTFSVYLGRGVPRWQIILAKMFAQVVPALLIVLILTSICTIVSGYYTIHFTGELAFSKVNFLRMVYSVFLGGFSLLPYGALSVLLSIIGRSLIFPLLGGIGWILIELISFRTLYSLSNVGKSISILLPIGTNMSLLQPSEEIVKFTSANLTTAFPWSKFALYPPHIAALVVAGYLILLGLITLVIFYRQDINCG